MSDLYTDYGATKTVIGNRSRNPGVVRKESDLNAARRSGSSIQTDKKLTPGLNKATTGDHAKIAKLDRENEVAPPPKVSAEVGKTIQTARQAASLTQKDLAQKINEKPSVLQDYESGKAVPNQNVLQKLERVLGVKLRGKAEDIGKKLDPPGAKKKAAAAASGSK